MRLRQSTAPEHQQAVLARSTTGNAQPPPPQSDDVTRFFERPVATALAIFTLLVWLWPLLRGALAKATARRAVA